MKQYPLDVQPLNEYEPSLLGWYTKGHHDPEAFLLALLDGEGENARASIGPVRHETWRTIPDPIAADGYTYFHPATPGRRGAFPVTVADRIARRRS